MGLRGPIYGVLFTIILTLSFFNCFLKPDYNLPLFAALIVVWYVEQLNVTHDLTAG